jgi:hypothetical protein
MANSNNWGEIYKSTWWGDEDWSANSLKIDSAPAGFAFTGILDTFTGAAAAYSLRQLSSTYSGSALRVRRSSDDTEQDIGFNASNDLDTAALLSFVGTGGTDNGFVTIWYDQSGNGKNATNATASAQPKIVDGGSVAQFDGINSILFDGSDDNFSVTMNLNTTAFSSFVVGGEDGTLDNTAQHFYASDNDFFSRLRNLDFESKISASPSLIIDDDIGQTTDDMLLLSVINRTSPAEGSQYVNGTIGNRSPLNTSGSGGINESTVFIGIKETTLPIRGGISEMIFFESDQHDNRTGIETNINDHFNIYTP